MQFADGGSFSEFATEVVGLLQGAAGIEAFDAAVPVFEALGFSWLNLGVAHAETYQLVRYRSTMPVSAFGAAVAAIDEAGEGGDYVYTYFRDETAALWHRPGRDNAAPASSPLTAAFVSLDVNLMLAMPAPMPGLVAGVTAYALGEAAEARLDDPELRRRAEFAARLLAAYYDPIGDDAALDHPERVLGLRRLSVREREALTLIARGRQLARAAHEMGVSEPMAARHLSSARGKLGAKTREHAVALAIRLGLIDI